MNDKDHAVYEALLRVNRFGAENAAAFDPADLAVLAEWSIASRIHRTGRSTPEDTPRCRLWFES